jgi:hypothetical protein
MTSVRELTDEPIIKMHDDQVMYCPWDWNYITDGDWYCHRHQSQAPM